MSFPYSANTVPTRNQMPFVVPQQRTAEVIPMPEPAPEPPPAVAMRRPSQEQGRALELLGRAIEYLVDEHNHYNRGEAVDSDAVRLLMQLNRAVFAECEVVLPWAVRLRQWMTSMVAA
jgi:hypothetical protein